MRGLVWLLALLMAFSLAANVFLYRESKAAKNGRDVDTLTVTDTIVIREPVAVESVVVRTEYKWLRRVDTVFASKVDTLADMHGCNGDTVMVEVPIEQKVYSDSDYTAWVSGYLPRLDSIQVYRKETVIRSKSRRWSIGVQTGYGITTKGFAPYVGIGFGYRIK